MLSTFSRTEWPPVCPEEKFSTYHQWVWCQLLAYHIQPSLCLGTCLLYPLCWEIFSWTDVEFCQMLSCTYWNNHMIFTFQFGIWCITLINLQILNHPSISGISSTWSQCMIHLIHYWIQSVNILLEFLLLCLLETLFYNFIFLWCPCLVLTWQ